MHEMGIATSVIDAIRTEIRRFPDAHVCKVGLRIGELAGVDPDAVRFCFEALVRGSELEPLELAIERRPRQHVCALCAQPFSAANEDSLCPSCGSPDSLFSGGDELEIAYVEVEDGASAARA